MNILRLLPVLLCCACNQVSKENWNSDAGMANRRDVIISGMHYIIIGNGHRGVHIINLTKDSLQVEFLKGQIGDR